MATKRGNQTVVAPHTLEFAPACKQLTLVLLAISLISFTVTWYKVWWDSIIAVCVMVYGYWVLRDTNPAHLKPARVRNYHYGIIFSLTCHIIAIGEATYSIIKLHLLKNFVREAENPGIPLFVFLYLFLLFEVAVTSFGVEKSYNLCQEISRNEYFLQSEALV